MREIKFRALDCIGQWWYGYYLFEQGEHMIYVPDDDGKDGIYPIVRGDTVGQYTGLKDQKGKEIYEGDILEGGILVTWSGQKASFALKRNGWLYHHFFDEAFKINDCPDVIGNIHENPELLKGDGQ